MCDGAGVGATEGISGFGDGDRTRGRLVNVLVLLEFYLEMVMEVGSGMVNVLVVQQKVVIEGGRWVMNVVMLL